jgi:Rieske Fe-S protein
VGARVLPVPEDASHIARGKGDVVKIHGERVAAYLDNQGVLHTLDPSCRHMGCIVFWNDAERTWDCPCHGSRYNIRGEAVHNPAVHELKERIHRNKYPI